ncbi:HNH endonuclease [Angustibacter luteus]|uniref:HNH endonuclease n=1 Tax=Angustibacter luteus TaxID=658456 RepID=UPI00366D0AB2
MDDVIRQFMMPKAVAITGRSSSITNSFINSIIPVVIPTPEEIRRALEILDMTEQVRCAYCADPHTEWDHLRPLVINKQPTGYISEIHNLVPSCGKCNQSKGNKHWRVWMLGSSPLSPASRGVFDLDVLALRLEQYEAWSAPTRLDFASLAGPALWAEHWDHHRRILGLMQEAQVVATSIRESVRAGYLAQAPTRYSATD